MSSTPLLTPTQTALRRLIGKIIDKYPRQEDILPVTDIYLRLKPEGGEVLVYDDDDNEVTRCVVEEWIGDTREDFYDAVSPLIQSELAAMQAQISQMGVLKPFSFVMQDEEGETVADLYLVDSDRIVLDNELMKGLDADLDAFWKQLAER
ncbi:MAG: hypothetical protein IJ786_01500 [Bacteroidaceae bacterium]|nr:hypothetical protein [Bacteroidaceae bacterium]